MKNASTKACWYCHTPPGADHGPTCLEAKAATRDIAAQTIRADDVTVKIGNVELSPGEFLPFSIAQRKRRPMKYLVSYELAHHPEQAVSLAAEKLGLGVVANTYVTLNTTHDGQVECGGKVYGWCLKDDARLHAAAICFTDTDN